MKPGQATAYRAFLFMVMKYETSHIDRSPVLQESDFTWSESDWIAIVDCDSGNAYEYNRKTGEKRDAEVE